jgi:hypothetical protein
VPEDHEDCERECALGRNGWVVAIFAIIAPHFNPSLTGAMQREFPRHMEFSPGQFVASIDGLTATQISQKLGPEGQVGQFVVFHTTGYWGFHRKDLWEWLTVNTS